MLKSDHKFGPKISLQLAKNIDLIPDLQYALLWWDIICIVLWVSS